MRGDEVEPLGVLPLPNDGVFGDAEGAERGVRTRWIAGVGSAAAATVTADGVGTV